jgi:peptidoglycan/xylan/chitin deacetylase (PgdA/CDA1 family)
MPNEGPTPGVVVLLYHDVLPPGSGLTADPQSIPFDVLTEHLRALRGAGFEGVPLAEAFPQLIAPTGGGKKFAVTFDDGYGSLAEYLPQLKGLILPTVFLLTGYAGLTNLAWNTRSPVIHRHLSVAQARDLAKQGVDLQLHGSDHHNLVKFDRVELCRRFELGILQFLEQFQRRARFLSYPYGYCSEVVREVAAHYFDGAFSVTHGAWSGEEARYAINRLSVPAYLSGEDLLAVVAAPPSDRWYECERRAPWRRGTGRASRRPAQQPSGDSHD